MTNKVRFFEDYQPGDAFDLGERLITEQETVAFASKYDPMPFHIDKEAATKSIYGGLTASGWQSCLIMMGMIHDRFLSMETSLGSPGMECSWLKPVRPGDCLRGRLVVDSVRISKSRPEMGLVTNTATLTNQNGDVVYRTRSVTMVRSRLPASGARQGH